jgi:hypothetical protein
VRRSAGAPLGKLKEALMTERGQQILMLAKAIQSTFSTSEWTEIGYITSSDEWIDSHPRLLRSLRWEDDDYKGHVLDAVKYVLHTDTDNLKKLFEYEPISRWLKKNERGFYDELFAEIFNMEVPHVIPNISTDSGFAALADAQALLREMGPTSAVDRVHTGLHALPIATLRLILSLASCRPTEKGRAVLTLLEGSE